MTGVSYNPSDMVEGGSLFRDGIYDVVGVKWEQYDYNGKITLRAGEMLPVALHLSLKDEDGQVNEQYVTATNLKYHSPSDDGAELIPVDPSRPNLTRNTNFALLMASLINAGFPVDKLDPDIRKIWQGMRFHGIWVDPPKRENRNSPAPSPSADGSTSTPAARVNKVLNVSQVLQYPWETGSAAPAKQAAQRPAPNSGSNGAAPASSSASSPAAGVAGSGSLTDDQASELFIFVADKISSAPNGKMLKSKLNGEVFKGFPDVTRRNAFVAAINSGWVEQNGIAELVGNEYVMRQTVLA